MKETIELREIIEILIKGKWIISIITIMGVLIAFVLNWFILENKYESKAVVQVASGVQDTGIMSSFVATEFTPLIYMQRINNEVLIKKVFEENNFENFDINNLKVTNELNTNLLQVSYQDLDANETQKKLQLLINHTKENMNDSVKKVLLELETTYLSESELLSNEIEKLMFNYNEIVTSNKLPELLILQTISNSQFVLELTKEQTATLSNMDGNIQNQLLQLKAQIDIKSNEYRNVLQKYQSVKTGLDSFNPDPFIRTIIEPTLPEVPFSPNKFLNLIVAFILSFTISTVIVFIQAYWKKNN